MSFPFFPLVLSFLAGLLLAANRPWPPGFGFPAVLIPLGLAWMFLGKRRLGEATAFAWIACAALGGVIFSAEEAAFARNPLSRIPPYAYIDIVGTVARSPSPGIDRDYLVLSVARISQGGRETAARGRIRVAVAHSTVSAARPDMLVGDEIRVAAQIVPAKEYRNFEEPFARRYLRTQGLHALAATKSPFLITTIRSGPAFSPRRAVSRLRRAFLRRIEAGFADPRAPGGLSADAPA